MPTAARLVAAIALAFAAYGVSGVVLYRHEYLQERGINHMFFAVVGFLVGWFNLGKKAQHGYRGGWAGGISSAIVAFVICTALVALHHVYKGMGMHAYDNVDELLTGFFSAFVRFGIMGLDLNIVAASLMGGILAGTFAAMAGRLWR